MPTIQSTKHFTCRQAHPTPLPILLFKTRTLTLLPLLLFKKTFPVTLMQALRPLRFSCSKPVPSLYSIYSCLKKRSPLLLAFFLPRFAEFFPQVEQNIP